METNYRNGLSKYLFKNTACIIIAWLLWCRYWRVEPRGMSCSQGHSQSPFSQLFCGRPLLSSRMTIHLRTKHTFYSLFLKASRMQLHIKTTTFWVLSTRYAEHILRMQNCSAKEYNQQAHGRVCGESHWDHGSWAIAPGGTRPGP